MSDEKSIGSIEKLIDAAESTCSLIKRIADKGASADTIASMGEMMNAATQALEFASKQANFNSEGGKRIHERLSGVKLPR